MIGSVAGRADDAMALVRVTRRSTGPTQRIGIARPRHRITRVAVLLRGSPKHIAVAARLTSRAPHGGCPRQESNLRPTA